MSLEQGKQQLSVLAHFADGSTRDVTDLVVYESSDQTVAAVDESGWIEAGSQGEAVILVRFLEHIESVPFMFVQRKPELPMGLPTCNELHRRIGQCEAETDSIPSVCNLQRFRVFAAGPSGCDRCSSHRSGEQGVSC